ncbi:hypothetical protein ACFQZJ_00765 [Maribacter chungangensis]|uniref:Uncharacterized protein n=1 Tax=Maribacter chungangensis TaxID=1069117 RepID=A0ABW3B018_9FLAO
MKNFLNSKHLKIALGFATGFAIYDYFAVGQVDWIRAIVTAILAVAIMAIFNGLKK